MWPAPSLDGATGRLRKQAVEGKHRVPDDMVDSTTTQTERERKRERVEESKKTKERERERERPTHT